MTMKEIRKLSPAELQSSLKDAKSELMNLRFQHAVNQLDNPLKIAEVKKTIARLMTVLRENELKAKA
ncbi:MAG: 50S ribosomal protein L29 [Clostridia bacterium]|jgi:large subunit ribosomal protein L29|nr:50S ribosomal protein L29 [Clostridia bacterium]